MQISRAAMVIGSSHIHDTHVTERSAGKTQSGWPQKRSTLGLGRSTTRTERDQHTEWNFDSSLSLSSRARLCSKLTEWERRHFTLCHYHTRVSRFQYHYHWLPVSIEPVRLPSRDIWCSGTQTQFESNILWWFKQVIERSPHLCQVFFFSNRIEV